MRTTNFTTFYGLQLKACEKGLNWYAGSMIRGVNCSIGSAITLVEHNVDITHTQGYAEIRNEVDVTVKNAGGSLIQNCRVYVSDTNNGDRKVYNLNGQNIDNTLDKVYLGSTDISGNVKWLGNSNSILLCAVTRLTQGTVVGVDDSGLNKKDIRSITNIKGTDDFLFHYWAYTLQYFSSIEIVQSNGTPYKIVQTILPDIYTTLSETNAAAKLASSFIVIPSNNLTNIISNSTLDDIYDAMKSFKTANVQTQLEYPTISTQPFNGSGKDLSTIMNIDISSGVTVSTGTKFNNLSTTGTISASLISGGRYFYQSGKLGMPSTSPNFSSGILTIGSAGVYNFTSDNSLILKMTPTGVSNYIFTGVQNGIMDLRNKTSYAIGATLPIGTTYTTANNTSGAISVSYPPITLTILRSNIIDGSNFLLKNVSTSGELSTGTVSGGTGVNITKTLGVDYSANDILELRIGYCVGTNAKNIIVEQISAPSSTAINSAPTTQTPYTIYNAIGINGSSRTEFSADYANNEVDINVGVDFLRTKFHGMVGL